ncbi:cation:proton antiporter regulatory subunit [Georgenia sp. EYE_87]|uniref:cation:proton antiporter regulatory subunit n=1 Tax=Georgenia sp. EYE_87 TaxID=2853448 RepID=UPI00200493BE|nr:cation:proton antiporter regulatory subunit [Georgenia sp. EYE_87]MCK6208940.1 cation:proton antiporter regulatory subunit [Georgenia sp. EYE_87]
MDVVETLLPGVGIKYELRTRTDLLIGIVVKREGPVEIAVYDSDDPDQARTVVHLDTDEADAVADILGAPRMAHRLADLSREVPGLNSARLSVRPGSPYAGKPLGETRARTLTGCSIVAVVRDSEIVPGPGPDEPLLEGDVLVAVGSEAGLEKLSSLLSVQG